jgi:MFS family permease
MFSFSAYISMLGLALNDRFGFRALELGFTSMGCSVVIIFGQFFIFNFLAGKVGKHMTAAIGGVLMAVGLFPLPFVEPMWAVFVLLFVNATGFACMYPALNCILPSYAPEGSIGKVMGLAASIEASARVVGPIVLGILYSEATWLPFVLCGGTSLLSSLAIVLILQLNRRGKRKRQEGVVRKNSSVVLPSAAGSAPQIYYVQDEETINAVAVLQALRGLLHNRGFPRDILHDDSAMLAAIRDHLAPYKNARGARAERETETEADDGLGPIDLDFADLDATLLRLKAPSGRPSN